MFHAVAVVAVATLLAAGRAEEDAAPGALARAANRPLPRRLSLLEGAVGPDVVRVQVLLDRDGDSPGAIDGRWSRNGALALRAFQERRGLPATGRLDRRTLRALVAANDRAPAIGRHTITEADLEGPFVQIPEREADQARLRCLCYESPSEKLAERFHTTPGLLRALNPGRDLDHLAAGERVAVPSPRPDRGTSARVERIVVHTRDGYLRALDRRGRLLFHFPVTVGARYARTPTGRLEVTRVSRSPTWRDEVTPGGEGLELPAGPNNPVGVVWMALSEKGYGIHGTNEPETIGHSSSHGCVRLTNWDALRLARAVRVGTEVDLVE